MRCYDPVVLVVDGFQAGDTFLEGIEVFLVGL